MWTQRLLAHRLLVSRRGLSSGPKWNSPRTPNDGERRDLERRLKSAASFDNTLSPDQVQFAKSPYPERETRLFHKAKRTESVISGASDDSSAKERDDRASSVLLFPGQGAQFVGMGQQLLSVPNVKDMFERASHILNYDLLDLCLHGTQSSLDRTIHCQPATVVASLAAVEKLYHECPEAVEKCIATAGFSVGEITALIFSGALSFDDGIRLVKIRAEAMQYCSELAPSGMMTVFFGADNKVSLAMEAAKKWSQEKFGLERPVCVTASYLYAGAKVLAGHEQALQFIEDNKNDFGIRKTKRLPVSGAFHTDLMKPAVSIFKEAVRNTEILAPRIPVHSNVQSRVLHSDRAIRETLPKQIVTAIKWEQCMNVLFPYKDESHVPSIYECGPGSALCSILSKINGKVAKRAKYIPV